MERTFRAQTRDMNGWLNRQRRLSKDYELLPEVSEAMYLCLDDSSDVAPIDGLSFSLQIASYSECQGVALVSMDFKGTRGWHLGKGAE